MADKHAADAMDPTLREIFRLAYYFRKKYGQPTRAKQFWHNAATEMSALVARFEWHPFARDVFLACYVDIERECLEGKPNAEPEPEQVRLL